ncbi:MAG: type VI secretion system tip protein VgrG [Planctomycetaceae bacterium]|nr:type VI secretion system tip protein VgrG [Planctomycetaceae bacterium]
MSADGLDSLQPSRFVIREGVSQPFRIDLEFRAAGTLDLAKFLGKHVTLTFQLQTSNGVRTIDGLVSRAAIVGTYRDQSVYRARLRPWSWFLKQSSDCRIFQNQSVPDIISAVASERGLGPLQKKLSGTYASVEYCVQYNESDANFLHRLLEENGISYVFSHAAGAHTLILTDDVTKLGAVDGYADVALRPGTTGTVGQPDHFRTWSGGRAARTGTVTMRDYDFTKPRVDLTKDSAAAKPVFSALEWYSYPGRYTDASAGATLAAVRLDAMRSAVETVRASGTARGLQPGATVKVSTHPRSDQNQEYIVLEAEHRIVAPWHAPGPGEENWYSGRYRLQPSANTIRPRFSARRPRILGPQTAVVVGPSGQETYTDSYGRIKVQFHWDRLGKNDDKSSCWIRCAQPVAGKGFGAFALPRVGQEVIVEFLNGDPDRPLATGTVFNADMTGPLTLPDQASRTSLKTKTIGADSPDQGHELTFEDAANGEYILLHSERDFQRVVENNDDLKVGFEKKNPGNQTISIFNNQTVTIGDSSADDGSQSMTIKNKRDVTISQGADSLTVSKGDWNVTLSAGSATISAAKQIVLKVGDSQLTLDTSGITLKGTSIAINADGSFTAKGAEIQEEASASMTLKGGVVQIN